jgi:hypothetical protein
MLCQVVSSCVKLSQVVSSCVKLYQVVSSCVKFCQVVSSCVKLCQVVSSCFMEEEKYVGKNKYVFMRDFLILARGNALTNSGNLTDFSLNTVQMFQKY